MSTFEKRKTLLGIRTLLICCMLMIICTFVCTTHAHGLDSPYNFEKKEAEAVLDVRSDVYLTNINISNINIANSTSTLTPGTSGSAFIHISNIGTVDAFVEIQPGIVMLNLTPGREPVDPYPAPRDLYRLGCEIINPNQNTDENGHLIYDPLSETEYYDKFDADMNNRIPPIRYLRLPAGEYGNIAVEADRYFLVFPGAGEYYLYDDDNGERMTDEDGDYKTRNVAQYGIDMSLIMDFNISPRDMGNEWNGSKLIMPYLKVADAGDKEDLYAAFGLTEDMLNALEDTNELPKVDLNRESDSPLIYFTVQPAVLTTVAEGDINESLTVLAGITDNSALSYQWYSNTAPRIAGGEPIFGATNTVFSIPQNLEANGSPYYFYCVVSSAGAADSATSNVAMVRVTESVKKPITKTIMDPVTGLFGSDLRVEDWTQACVFRVTANIPADATTYGSIRLEDVLPVGVLVLDGTAASATTVYAIDSDGVQSVLPNTAATVMEDENIISCEIRDPAAILSLAGGTLILEVRTRIVSAFAADRIVNQGYLIINDGDPIVANNPEVTITVPIDVKKEVRDSNGTFTDEITITDIDQILTYRIAATLPADTSGCVSIELQDILPQSLMLAESLEDSVKLSVSGGGIELISDQKTLEIKNVNGNTTICCTIAGDILLTQLAGEIIVMEIDTIIDSQNAAAVITNNWRMIVNENVAVNENDEVPPTVVVIQKAVINITTEPADVSVTEGGISGGLTIAATVSPSGTPGYQWYRQLGASPNPATDTAVGTGAGFSIPAALTAGTYYYYCVVSATDAESVISRVSKVTVTAKGPNNAPDPAHYTVSIIAGPGGTASGGGNYEEGETAAISAAPSGVYIFEGWYEDELRVSNDRLYSFAVDGNIRLEARFTKESVYHTISLSVGTGGTATGNGSYEKGTAVCVTAIPDYAYYFDGWFEGAEKVSDSMDFIFATDRNRTLEARFVLGGDDDRLYMLDDAEGDDGDSEVITLHTANSGGALTKKEVFDQLAEAGIGENDRFSIRFDETVRTIASNAFSLCRGLTTVDIPSNLTSIGPHAFSFCYDLTEINVSPDNAIYSTFDGVLFNKNKTILIAYPAGKAGDYSILGSVTDIGSYAFEGCSKLTGVSIPDSVTSISFRAFSECVNLTEFIVSTNNSAYSSDNGVIFNKNKTTIIRCPFGKSGSYTVPTGVISIGDYAFSNCSKLTGINLRDSVAIIGDDAFYYCTGIKFVTIPHSVESTGTAAFFGCYDITNAIMQDGVSIIDEYAFALCGNLVNLNLPDSVKSIGNFAFSYCTDLVDAVIPNGAESIGVLAFEGTDVKTIKLPPSVSTYQLDDFGSGVKGAFSGMSALESIVLEPDTEGISENTFKGISANVNIFVPKSVSYINPDSGLNRNTTVYVFTGSYAEDYAKKNDIPYVTLPTISIEIGKPPLGYQYLPYYFGFESSGVASLELKSGKESLENIGLDISLESADGEKRIKGEIFGIPAENGIINVTLQAKDENEYPLKDEVTFEIEIKEKIAKQKEIDDYIDQYNETDDNENNNNKARLKKPLGTYDPDEDTYIIKIYEPDPNNPVDPDDEIFIYEGNIEDFIGLWINGKMLERGFDLQARDGDYYVTSGSIIVTLYGHTIARLYEEHPDTDFRHVMVARFKDSDSGVYEVAQSFKIVVVPRLPNDIDPNPRPDPNPSPSPGTGGNGSVQTRVQTPGAPLASTPAPTSPGTDQTPLTMNFVDVKETDWFAQDVLWVYQNGIMIGVSDTEFAPYAAINPAMISLTLARILDVDLAAYISGNSSWFSESYSWANGQGLFDGTEGLSHDMPYNRGRLAVSLARLMNGVDLTPAAVDESFVFADEELMLAEESAAAMLLYKLGIIKGKENGVMDPQGVTIRAELATILHRTYEYVTELRDRYGARGTLRTNDLQ